MTFTSIDLLLIYLQMRKENRITFAYFIKVTV